MIILGIDEAGRGPLAGPVVAAAVILNSQSDHIQIKDSKKLSEKKIIAVSTQIKECSIYSIGIASVDEIEELNILQSTMLAMRRAIKLINDHYDIIHVDGNQNPIPNDKNIVNIIGGDNLCRSIAAASIIAKAYRDQLMRCLNQQYPDYQFAQNKGYGTKKHIAAIKCFGISPVHRKSFCNSLCQ
jgi:ribonuclease HII